MSFARVFPCERNVMYPNTFRSFCCGLLAADASDASQSSSAQHSWWPEPAVVAVVLTTG